MSFLLADVEPLVLYRWPDGASVEVEPTGSWDNNLQKNTVTWLYTLFCEGKKSVVTFRMSLATRMMDRNQFVLVGPSPRLPKAAEPYLRGFLFEQGVPKSLDWRHPSFRYLIKDADGPSGTWKLEVPYFVADDLWDRRYEIAKEYDRSTTLRWYPTNDFLGVVHRLELRRVMLSQEGPDKDLWIARATTGQGVIANHLRFEPLIDKVLEGYSVRPERDRAAWTSEHVLRGEWVNPTVMEVEVFLLLGEPLPFLWSSDRFYDWYLERRSLS